MIDPASLAFDIDGVIADTMTLFLDIARNDYQIDGIAYEDITRYSLVDCLDVAPEILHEIGLKIIDGHYSLPLRTMAGAAEVLPRLADCHAPVLFVTARPRLGPIGDWIQENLFLAPHQIEVVTTGDFDNKATVLLEKKITHFVEDRLETCFAIETVGITPIVFKQPWNRMPHAFLEVDNWADLARLIDFNGGSGHP